MPENTVSESIAQKAANQPCPRCEREKLAAQMTPERIAQIAAELPISEKAAAAPEEYKARLETCAVCDALKGGVLCSWCGCYVILRARPKQSYCPYPGCNKWKMY
ncbi:MAG: hypothetical protein J5747_07475 [Spirochaetaceae bacterium]|nr:hypothetical protein [Spirochaetaceae bacterium]